MNFQIIMGGQCFITDGANNRGLMFPLDMSRQFLSTLARKLALIAVDQLVTSLVFPHVANVRHFLKTNLALKYLLRLTRMLAFQVTGNVTYSFITYRTNMHILEVYSHVSKNKPFPLFLIVAEATKVCLGSIFLSVDFNTRHRSFHYFFVNINYWREQASLTIKF